MKRRHRVAKQIILMTFSVLFYEDTALCQSLTQLNSLGSYVWSATDAPKTFNDKLQISFVRSSMGFPSYGTVLAGGGYSSSQDGAVFQIYFPYNAQMGGIAPKIRMGQYNNQGWTNWETFYTSANANSSTADWTTKNLIAYGNVLIGKTSQTNSSYKLDVNGNIRANKVVVNATGADYVFDSAYQLRPIDSLSSYVSRYHHLPGILSAPNSGNVGVGTTDPSDELTIQGNNAAMLLQSSQSPTGYYTEFVNQYNAANPFYIKVGMVKILGVKNIGPYSSIPYMGGYYGTALTSGNTDPVSSNIALYISGYDNPVPPGNVGIGTTSPVSLLQIGSTTAKAKAYLIFGKRIISTESDLPFIGQDCINGSGNDLGLGAWSSSGGINFYTGVAIPFTHSNIRMRIDASGNVLIGKTSQTNTSYKLDVNGNVRANKVVVNATGADYVFDAAYQLRPIDSLNKYITIHHHLPGIFPAGKMQKTGMDVGETQAVLLKKVEELTLYVISLQKQITTLKSELQNQDHKKKIIHQ